MNMSVNWVHVVLHIKDGKKVAQNIGPKYSPKNLYFVPCIGHFKSKITYVVYYVVVMDGWIQK
jgi:hypothetical protein